MAIFSRSLRDSATLLVLASAGSIVFVVLFTWAMQNLGPELLEFLSKFDFLKRIFEVSLGVKMSGEISSNIMYAVSFTHLVVLISGWGPIIAMVTSATTGEEERGTADLLLSLPVQRWTVYFSTSLVWVFSAAVLAACPLAGVAIGSAMFPFKEEIRLPAFVPVSINLFALHLAIGGVTSMISCCSSRRGQVIAVVVALTLVSVTMNFVEPFIPVIERFNFLGLLHYYRPVDVVRNSSWPIAQIMVLAGFGLMSWLAGMFVYCRKDVPVG